MGMSNLTAGLLGAFSGALGAGEQAYQSQLAQQGKMSLEQYKHDRQVALEKLRAKNQGTLATEKDRRAAERSEAEQTAQTERNRETIAGRLEQEKMRGERAKEDKAAISTAKTAAKDNAEQIAFGSARDTLASVIDPSRLPMFDKAKSIEDIIKTLEKAKTSIPRATELIEKFRAVQAQQRELKNQIAGVQTYEDDPIGRLNELQKIFESSTYEMLGVEDSGLLGPQQAAVPGAPPPQPGGAASSPPPGFKLLD
jgi:hypothetical protein